MVFVEEGIEEPAEGVDEAGRRRKRRSVAFGQINGVQIGKDGLFFFGGLGGPLGGGQFRQAEVAVIAVQEDDGRVILIIRGENFPDGHQRQCIRVPHLRRHPGTSARGGVVGIVMGKGLHGSHLMVKIVPGMLVEVEGGMGSDDVGEAVVAVGRVGTGGVDELLDGIQMGLDQGPQMRPIGQ